MKSVKEFIFLSRECGFFHALFFVFFKLRLKFRNSTFMKKKAKNEERWLEKIYAALFIQQNETENIDNRDLIKVKIRKDSPAFVYLRPYSSDRDVYLQVLVNEDYKSVVQIYDQLFKDPPREIVDCGCNIGLTSVYFKLQYPNAGFTAIEPFQDNVGLISLNFAGNSINTDRIIEGGVWNSNEKLKVGRQFRDGKEWSGNVEMQQTGSTDPGIQAYSILDIINRHENGVDILKIDIEGAEKVLFEDIGYARKFLEKVKCVAIEIHDEFNCRDNIYKAFRESNFFYYDIADMTIAINRTYLPQ